MTTDCCESLLWPAIGCSGHVSHVEKDHKEETDIGTGVVGHSYCTKLFKKNISQLDNPISFISVHANNYFSFV